MYLIDDNTRRCVGVIDVVRMDSPDIMGGVIHRATSIEVILDGRGSHNGYELFH